MSGFFNFEEATHYYNLLTREDYLLSDRLSLLPG